MDQNNQQDPFSALKHMRFSDATRIHVTEDRPVWGTTSPQIASLQASTFTFTAKANVPRLKSQATPPIAAAVYNFEISYSVDTANGRVGRQDRRPTPADDSTRSRSYPQPLISGRHSRIECRAWHEGVPSNQPASAENTPTSEKCPMMQITEI
ncbi:hypothetical protein BU16DRAFT_555622 [Lophium mytilinum]|uniref:Uncharacterized protein n=1 Tax=Lophium mytilinum TaxID=390894 RepID=A0A6A6RBN8_9PEZI|nr:hypothetical protein BU16DRAFT_555622 [Lophium mytilinum]